jgi:ADP-heptose:LPS heptosyltransferase
MNTPLTKFLIIRFSSIGDIVLTTPVIRCLKNQVPGVELHYCTKKQYASILEHNKYIDKLHLFNDSFKEIVLNLKLEKFDFVIDLHNSLRSRRLRIALGIPSRTFNKINFKKWLKVKFKIHRRPDLHIVDRYLDTLRPWKVTNDMQGLDYFLPPGIEKNRELLPASHLDGYVGFATGARHFTKQPPADLMIRICSLLNFPVVLLGGPEDMDKAEEVARQFPGKVWNSCGKMNLNQSAFIVKEALAIITPDTGLMHIAAAYKKIIISLWGNTIPEFGMSPYLPDPLSRIFEITGLACRPCSKIGYMKCPKAHFKCMNNLPADSITRYTNEVICQTHPRE